MQFYVMTRTHVRQFKLSKMPQYNIVNKVSSYFHMTGFKATVCASTGDNRHSCAPTTWSVAPILEVPHRCQLPLHVLGTNYHPVSLQRLSVYFQKKTQNRTSFSRRFLPWLFTCVCVYYFTCFSFMFIFCLSACAAHVSCLYRALAAKFSLCHVNLFVN